MKIAEITLQEVVSFVETIASLRPLLSEIWWKFVELVQALTGLFPFVMSWVWIAGGLTYWLLSERKHRKPDQLPPREGEWPKAAVIVPCYNEGETVIDTIEALAHLEYPDFEVIAVNDGSSDDTLEFLQDLQRQHSFLRVVNLEQNKGKATAMKMGALASNAEYLACIDGDALLAPKSLHWIVHSLTLRKNIGATTGNPRIRNRGSLLGRLQVGEFSSIVGLIKRTQMTFGMIFTVSGVICGFRRRALHDVGWWGTDMLTDDIDISWRMQEGGWRVRYEPNALCWILMPETFRGLWKQRLRWAQGGAEVVLKRLVGLFRGGPWRMVPLMFEQLVSVLWAHSVFFITLCWILWLLPSVNFPDIGGGLFPALWGILLAATFLFQSVVSMCMERRYEGKFLLRHLFLLIWYPTVFWLITCATAVLGFHRAWIFRRKRFATWSSPDRGFT